MSFPSDMDFEGYAVPLDTLDMETADRLLAGTVAPEDAPPGYAEVTRLLQAAWTEPTPDEIPGELVIVARMADVVRSSSSTASFSPHERRKPIRLIRPRIAAALVAAALACSAGLASAGALPDAIQEVVSATLAKVGISVPGSNESAPKDWSGKARPGRATSGAGTSGERSAPARVKERAGRERRARPTTAASIGKSRGGQRRSPSKTPNPTGAGKGSGRSAPRPPTAEPTGVEKRAGPAVAASVGKGRAAQHRSMSRRPSSSSRARVAANAGGKGEAATEPKSTRPTRPRPPNAGGDGRGVPASSGATGGQGSGGFGGQGSGASSGQGNAGSGGQGSGGSGGQGSGSSGNSNSGDPRGP
jgi:hypothetical protein